MPLAAAALQRALLPFDTHKDAPRNIEELRLRDEGAQAARVLLGGCLDVEELVLSLLALLVQKYKY